MADLRHNGIMDLAVLTTGGLTIYFGNGAGSFTLEETYAVGPDSTGLAVADVNHDGNLDLLVGDSYGDVLILFGNGAGAFQPYHEADQAVELAAADLTGNGQEDIVYADQGLDRVVVDYGAGESQLIADQSQGLLDPGAVLLARLAGPNYPPDLIIADSGANRVLIYPGQFSIKGQFQFGPEVNGGQGYFVGTDPVAVTAADLTGNGKRDLLIADEGSNEVSILINQSQDGRISFDHGERLNAGGIGPVSTAVAPSATSPYPNIFVTNSVSSDVAVLPGVGLGLFDDQDPTIHRVGPGPMGSVSGTFNGQADLVTLDAGSNDLTLIANIENSNPAITTIASGGLDPDAGFAFDAGDGFDDLVVADSGDDTLALLAGGPDGLSLRLNSE